MKASIVLYAIVGKAGQEAMEGSTGPENKDGRRLVVAADLSAPFPPPFDL